MDDGVQDLGGGWVWDPGKRRLSRTDGRFYAIQMEDDPYPAPRLHEEPGIARPDSGDRIVGYGLVEVNRHGLIRASHETFRDGKPYARIPLSSASNPDPVAMPEDCETYAVIRINDPRIEGSVLYGFRKADFPDADGLPLDALARSNDARTLAPLARFFLGDKRRLVTLAAGRRSWPKWIGRAILTCLATMVAVSPLQLVMVRNTTHPDRMALVSDHDRAQREVAAGTPGYMLEPGVDAATGAPLQAGVHCRFEVATQVRARPRSQHDEEMNARHG
jgi:hypothetical protein